MTELLVIVVAVLSADRVAYIAIGGCITRKAEVAARNVAQWQQNLTILERAAPSLLRDEYVAQSEVDSWKLANSVALWAAQQVQLARSLDNVSADVYRTPAQQLLDPDRTTLERNQSFL